MNLRRFLIVGLLLLALAAVGAGWTWDGSGVAAPVGFYDGN